MNCDVRVAVRVLGILNSLIGFWNRPLLAVAFRELSFEKFSCPSKKVRKIFIPHKWQLQE